MNLPTPPPPRVRAAFLLSGRFLQCGTSRALTDDFLASGSEYCDRDSFECDRFTICGGGRLTDGKAVFRSCSVFFTGESRAGEGATNDGLNVVNVGRDAILS